MKDGAHPSPFLALASGMEKNVNTASKCSHGNGVSDGFYSILHQNSISGDSGAAGGEGQP